MDCLRLGACWKTVDAREIRQMTMEMNAVKQSNDGEGDHEDLIHRNSEPAS